MKYNYLKKVGAVALAAVMAVTFAPTAALDVFAADATATEKNGKYVISGAGLNYNVTTSGTFVVSDDGITVKVGGVHNATIDLGTAKSTTIEFDNTTTASQTAITVIGRKNGYNSATGNFDVTDVKIKNVASAGALKVSGEMKITLDNDNGVASDLETDARPLHSYKNVFGSIPVAFANNDGVYLVGETPITKATQDGEADIYAVNGAVKATGLKDGHTAQIYTGAAVGTTIDATAEADKSLTKVVTKYDYEFYTKSNSNQGSYGKSVYTDTKFAAGAGSYAKAIGTDAPDACYSLNTTTGNIDTHVTTNAQISTKALSVKGYVTGFTYDRAVTLTQDDKDKFENVYVEYVDPQTYEKDAHGHKDGRGSHDGASGITYFTKNPAGYTDPTDGVAVLDGSKYVIDDLDEAYMPDGTLKDGQLATVSEYAGTSLAILRGTSKDATADNAMNPLHTKVGVKVTAPTSSSIVLGHYSYITKEGAKSTTVNNGYVYGSRHVEGVNNGNEGNIFANEAAELSDTVVDSTIEVPQVADGTYAVVIDGYTDAKVTKADSLGYFYEQKVTQIAKSRANFVFAAPSVAKDAFSGVLSGTLVNGTTYFTKAIGGETLYASKEIKGKFKNANAKVTVLGEISAVKDASNVWTVNEGYASAAVPAYRMYRKSGEHVYTINPDEVTMLTNAGWINEGVAFTVNSVASKTGTPIYRLYNRNGGGMHFYTASAAERDMLLANGWTEGKEVFYGATKATGIPVYRTYNTGSNNGEHNYTTNIKESDMNVKAGWRAEGVAFYVFK